MSATPLASTGVVVVHFHREGDAARVVRDVVDQGVDPASVVLVDNGSESSLLARELAGRGVAPVVLTRDNIGFGAAANEGERRLPEHVDTVVVLSHEVELPPEALARLRRTLVERGAAVVGPLLLDTTRPGRLWSAGGRFLPLAGVPVHRLNGALVGDAPAEIAACDWLDGAVLVVDRASWRAVGGFDDRFWLSHEDVDLCCRLAERGAVLLDPGVQVGQSPGGHLDRQRATRNMVLLQRLRGRWIALLAWLLWSGLVAVGRAVTGRDPRPVVRGIREGLAA